MQGHTGVKRNERTHQLTRSTTEEMQAMDNAAFFSRVQSSEITSNEFLHLIS